MLLQAKQRFFATKMLVAVATVVACGRNAVFLAVSIGAKHEIVGRVASHDATLQSSCANHSAEPLREGARKKRCRRGSPCHVMGDEIFFFFCNITASSVMHSMRRIECITAIGFIGGILVILVGSTAMSQCSNVRDLKKTRTRYASRAFT